MRAWQISGVFILALLAALTSGKAAFGVLAAICALLLVAGGVYRTLAATRVRCQLVVSATEVAWGQHLEERIVVRNPARIALLHLAVLDGSTLPGHERGYVGNLGPGREVRRQLATVCMHRGAHTVGPLTTQVSDPLGMFPINREIAAAQLVLVLPRIVTLVHSPFLFEALVRGDMRGRLAQETPPEPVSVRPYHRGDALRSVALAATRKAGMLMVRQYRPEVRPPFIIILDGDAALDAATDDLLATCAASFAEYALNRAALRVGLVQAGQYPAPVLPGTGIRQHQRLMRTIALARAGATGELVGQLAAYRWWEGSVVLLITAASVAARAPVLAWLQSCHVTVRVIHIAATPAPWSVPALTIPPDLADPQRAADLALRLQAS